VILDDSSKTSARIRDNFEGVVYDLCSGKGKSRSNKDLGVNRENHWKCAFLTNGERPLQSYVNQGGAINRILEVECGDKIFPNPQETADILKRNYGFAGKKFVDIIKSMDIAELKQIQQDFFKQLSGDSAMDKQALSLSIVLTADKIATEQIFNDKQYITIEEAKEAMVDRQELSDNERCYQFLLNKIEMNKQRFDDESSCEKWGILADGYAIFFNQAFDDLCKAGGFTKKSFLSWAKRKSLVQLDSQGNPTKTKKMKDGNVSRCVFLKLNDGISINQDGFLELTEDEQSSLPFV
jgi:uncharacterized protein (DUF927 family)